MIAAILISLVIGFGVGRVHHISSLKAKVVKLEETLSADEKSVVAKVKALI